MGILDNTYFEVGIKKGEWDFGVSGQVSNLSYEEMRRAREMIVVGIGQFESMWRISRAAPSESTRRDSEKQGEGL